MEISFVALNLLEAFGCLIITVLFGFMAHEAFKRQIDRNRLYISEHPECWSRLNKYQRWYNDLHPTKNEML